MLPRSTLWSDVFDGCTRASSVAVHTALVVSAHIGDLCASAGPVSMQHRGCNAARDEAASEAQHKRRRLLPIGGCTALAGVRRIVGQPGC